MSNPSPPSAQRARGLRSRLGLLALKLLLMLLMIEGLLWVALLVAPPSLLHHLDYKVRAWHTDDNPHWGVWHIPSVSTRHVKSCVEATYTTNAFGMRDKERTEARREGVPRVAVLGDSFVEGYLVDDDKTLTRVLEDQVFSGRAEVLNFGTSGYFGTTQEWLIYEHLARRFHPDVVVLAFLNQNDLFDVSWQWWQKRPPRYRPYLIPAAEAEGSYDLFYPDAPPTQVKIGTVAENLLLRFSAIARVANDLAVRARYSGQPLRSLPVYEEPPGALVGEAWGIVEDALRRLQAATARDGAQLVVMQLMDPAQIDPARAAAVAAAPGHEVMAPQRRLRAIADRLGVRYLSLQDAFEAYRDTHDLAPPYFGTACDDHWSSLGHRVAAEALGAYLSAEGLIQR